MHRCRFIASMRLLKHWEQCNGGAMDKKNFMQAINEVTKGDFLLYLLPNKKEQLHKIEVKDSFKCYHQEWDQ